jgi:hypothetical protein
MERLVITQPPPNTIDYYLQFQIATDPAAPYVVEKQVPSGGVVNSQISLGTILAIQLVKKTGPPGGIRIVTPIVSAYSTVKDAIDPPFETKYNLFDDATMISLSSGAGNAVTLTAVCRAWAVCLQTESVVAPAAAAARACAKTGTRREHSPTLHRYESPVGAILDSARQGCTPRGVQLRTHQESPVP